MLLRDKCVFVLTLLCASLAATAGEPVRRQPSVRVVDSFGNAANIDGLVRLSTVGGTQTAVD